MQQTNHDEITRALNEHPAKNGLAFNLAVTVLEIRGAIGLFQPRQGQGRK